MKRFCGWIIVAILAIGSAHCRGQVHVVSPLPFGILQVHGNHANLRLVALLSNVSSFRFKLVSDTSVASVPWIAVSAPKDTVDTLLTVPSSLHSYSLYLAANSSGTEIIDTIFHLTPGHIIGVAGQSNAEGFCDGMLVGPVGDIRMLRPDSLVWQPATEPTGNAAGGPWIVMANMLYATIGDSLPVGIVNMAVGNTGLLGNFDTVNGEWSRNPANPEDTTASEFRIYGNALRKFRNAGSELEWFTWIQGETEGGYSGCGSPELYQAGFANLIAEFKRDMMDTFQVYHLQIGGDNGTGFSVDDYPEVRQAELALPSSTLIGTGLGLAVWDGRYHYDPPSLWSIGEMFAGAILKNQYGIATPMYPPLVPDSVSTLDSITDGSILGRYCFSVRWTRGGNPVKLTSLTPQQYFGISIGEIPLDTSYVWYRIAPDSTRVLVGYRNDSITLNYQWSVSYDYAAESDRAPIATIDTVSGDTIYAAAFFELPVRESQALVNAASTVLYNPQILPDPSFGTIFINVPELSGPVEATLLSEIGTIVWNQPLSSDHPTMLSFDLSAERSGCYWLRLNNGITSVERKFILER